MNEVFEAPGRESSPTSADEPNSKWAGSGDLSLDSERIILEPLPSSANLPSITEDTDKAADVHSHDLAVLIDSQEQTVSNINNARRSPTVGGCSSTDPKPEASTRDTVVGSGNQGNEQLQDIPRYEAPEQEPSSQQSETDNAHNKGEGADTPSNRLIAEVAFTLDKVEAHENKSLCHTTLGSDENADTGHGLVDEAVKDSVDNFWPSELQDDSDAEEDLFCQLKTQTKPIFVPAETDVRFEESVPPLCENYEAPAATGRGEDCVGQISGDTGGEVNKFSSENRESVQDNSVHSIQENAPQGISLIGDTQVPLPDWETSSTSLQLKQHSSATNTEALEGIPSEEDLAARWQEALADDGDLLLEDEAIETATAGHQPIPPSLYSPITGTPGLGNGCGALTGFSEPQIVPNSFAPHQPSTSELLQGVSLQGDTRANTVSVPSNLMPQPQSDTSGSRAESFAERSKEGYKSPYDIPMDLTRTRRYVGTRKPAVSKPGHPLVAPPRNDSTRALPPSSSTPTSSNIAFPIAASYNNFYEELPVQLPKSQLASSGHHTSGTSQSMADFISKAASSSQSSIQPYGETPRQPERPDGYINTLMQAPSFPPNAGSRYSPKPPNLQPGIKPLPSPRYSPVPPQSSAPPPSNCYASPSQDGGQRRNHPPLRRASSPLVYYEKALHYGENPALHPSAEQPTKPSPPSQLHSQANAYEPLQTPGLAENVAKPSNLVTEIREDSPSVLTEQVSSPHISIYASPVDVNESSKRPAFAVGIPPTPPAASGPAPLQENEFQRWPPPRRSQTQSPSSQQMRAPSLLMYPTVSIQRPASAHSPVLVHGNGLPMTENTSYAPARVFTHSFPDSEQLRFVLPSDEQKLDPLERWKGCPIIAFGFGGAIVSCFPKRIPRYVAGQTAPMIKPSPGEVRISRLVDWMPMAHGIVQHPGPLKTKSKKKDILAWLATKIAAYENEGPSEVDQLLGSARKRCEERILLWKIVKIVVENDGTLEGSANLQASLRSVILPDLQTTDVTQLYTSDHTVGSLPTHENLSLKPDAVNPQFMETLRIDLAEGKREHAVWRAVDNRLWGHAMVLASSLDKSVWKQVVQEFVRREVRSATGNTESLAALYEVFAGNAEESIDELVPPSARAGLQMISKASGSEPLRNALDGLDEWRDTLGLILSNRSPEDHRALLALGKLLSSYGRTDAAHICYIFSRIPVFGGVDDPQASMVLLGVDHQRFANTFFRDEDAILLTEAYEYATSVLAGTPAAALPHLLAFKLLYAKSLADRGSNSDALQYCDSIAAALKATTKPSAYYHQHLYSEVGELSARLRQTTIDSGSSWISKPSMEKVSGTMWARFNSFVSGEDSDATSAGSGKGGDADIGPFAKVSGTPTASRSPSLSDFYGPYAGSGAQSMQANSISRYHPASQHASNSSPEQLRGRSSFDSQRSLGPGLGPRRNLQEIPSPAANSIHQGASLYGSPPISGYQYTPPQSSHQHLAPVKEDMAPPKLDGLPYTPIQTLPADGIQYESRMDTTYPFGDTLPYKDSDAGLQAESVGYIPAGSNYRVPESETFATSAPGSNQSPTGDILHTGRSTVDGNGEDDTDTTTHAATILKEEKSRKDREVDEAFRKAAEEDAKKPPSQPKKSWFGGWFGGGKKDEHVGGGPIRAKLGENSSFYYDNDLKKWVNKKDPKGGAAVRATPPPPKSSAPPARAASATDPPLAELSQTTSNEQSSIGVPASDPAQRSVSTGAVLPPAPNAGVSLPPSRPATSLGNANTIDDLIGAPAARKGSAPKGKRKGRYVDVMAK